MSTCRGSRAWRLTAATLIYQKVFNNADTSFLINSINATLAILFTLNCTWLIDRIGEPAL